VWLFVIKTWRHLERDVFLQMPHRSYGWDMAFHIWLYSCGAKTTITYREDCSVDDIKIEVPEFPERIDFYIYQGYSYFRNSQNRIYILKRGTVLCEIDGQTLPAESMHVLAHSFIVLYDNLQLL
jgi:hypothetical protein